MRRVTPDTVVTVTRVVSVSTRHTIAELARATGEDVADVVFSFENRAHAEWLSEYRVAELVPAFTSADTADDVLDTDVWSVRVNW